MPVPEEPEKIKARFQQFYNYLKIRVDQLEKIDPASKGSKEWMDHQSKLLNEAMIIASTLSMIGSSKFDLDNNVPKDKKLK